jgi:hypothetical protein
VERLSSTRSDRVLAGPPIMLTHRVRKWRCPVSLGSLGHDSMVVIFRDVDSHIVGVIGIAIFFILEILWSSMFVWFRRLTSV